jgi:DNA recombination-dependent growth factor C
MVDTLAIGLGRHNQVSFVIKKDASCHPLKTGDHLKDRVANIENRFGVSGGGNS